MRFVIVFCFFLFCALSIPQGIKQITGGFRVAKMEIDFPYDPEWQGEAMSPEIRSWLCQPFFYLDRGSQCYVFASADENCVIKLFRFDRGARLFRSFFKLPLKKRKTDLFTKAADLFRACQLAYERVPEETGLLYIHVNRTEENLPVLDCRDALGRTYRLPLDRYRFVLQKKVEPFEKVLERNLQNKDEMKKCLDSILNLLLVRTEKRLHNSDPNLSRNIGFLNNRAIEIDFGNYRNCDDMDFPQERIQEMVRFCRPLRAWVREHAPDWMPYLDDRIKHAKQEMLHP